MNPVRFSVRRPVTVSMFTLAVVMFGLVAFQRLPIHLLPELSYPSLTVETRYPGAAPAEIEGLITRRVEEAVGILSGVRKITSRSKPGLSQVTLEFAWGREMALAALDVRQKVDLVRLPEGADKPIILRFDPSNDPVLRLYLTRKERKEDEGKAAEVDQTGLLKLRYVAEEQLKKDLESLDGVAAVKVNGGLEEEIQVQVDEAKLALVGLTPADVHQVLARENVNQAAGSLYEDEARYLVRANNEFASLDDIRATIVSEKDGPVVRLGDVARVERGHKLREVMTRFRGREAVELALYKEGDANTVRMAQGVRRRLEALRMSLPEGIQLGTGVDQSRFIENSIDEVLGNAVLGGLLAMLVLYLFLKDAFATAIVGASIPISIVATFFLMHRMGVSLNVMSLGGLALGVGLLVDNAIVVLEAIFRRKEAGESSEQAAERGASEVGQAVVASTLTTVAVFLPVVFVEGVAAQLFHDQAVTVSMSLLASLAVALTLIPMATARAGRARVSTPTAGAVRCLPPRPDVPWSWWNLRAQWAWRTWLACGLSHFMRETAPVGVLWLVRWSVRGVSRILRGAVSIVGRPFDAALGRVLERYPAALRWALARPWRVVGVALALFVAAALSVSRLGLDLIPSLAQGEFSYRVELPEGTPLAVTDRVLRRAQAALDGRDAVESYSAVVGGAGLSLSSVGTEGENVGRIDVRLASGTSSADEQAVVAALREELTRIPQARVRFERSSYFSFRTPIEVEVYGDDLQALNRVAGDLRERLHGLPGLTDVRSSAELGNPEIQVRFDREALARFDLLLGDVATTVQRKVRGTVATRFTEGDREIDVLVRSGAGEEVKAEDVERLIVTQKDGLPVYLSSVARIERDLGPSEIRRISQKRAAVVNANLAGRDLGQAAEEIRGILREYSFPVGVVASLSGQEEERQRSFSSLMLALGLALFLVYLVMAAQFESLLHPLVILLSVPLGGIGAVLALVLAGQAINVVVLIGFVMLGGIVVNNAIVLVDTVNRLRAEGLARVAALVQAGQRRLRPILMTTSTTALGLLPMALGLGEGAELRAPLAITVIGGLLAATLLTLVVIPAVYLLLDRRPDPQTAEDPERTQPARPGAAPAAAQAAAYEPSGSVGSSGGLDATALPAGK